MVIVFCVSQVHNETFEWRDYRQANQEHVASLTVSTQSITAQIHLTRRLRSFCNTGIAMYHVAATVDSLFLS